MSSVSSSGPDNDVRMLFTSPWTRRFDGTPRMIDIRTRAHALSAEIKHQSCSRVTPGPHVKLQRVETDFVGDTLKVMGLGRVGGHRGRKSCRSIRQAGLSTALLEAKPQSGGGRGRSHAVGDAADIAISGQPSRHANERTTHGASRLGVNRAAYHLPVLTWAEGSRSTTAVVSAM